MTDTPAPPDPVEPDDAGDEDGIDPDLVALHEGIEWSQAADLAAIEED